MEQPVYRQKPSKRPNQPSFDSPLVISEKEAGNGSNFQPKKLKQSILVFNNLFRQVSILHG
jgi:hypothetical protein